jgi:hypothetical protein
MHWLARFPTVVEYNLDQHRADSFAGTCVWTGSLCRFPSAIVCEDAPKFTCLRPLVFSATECPAGTLYALSVYPPLSFCCSYASSTRSVLSEDFTLVFGFSPWPTLAHESAGKVPGNARSTSL